MSTVNILARPFRGCENHEWILGLRYLRKIRKTVLNSTKSPIWQGVTTSLLGDQCLPLLTTTYHYLLLPTTTYHYLPYHYFLLLGTIWCYLVLLGSTSRVTTYYFRLLIIITFPTMPRPSMPFLNRWCTPTHTLTCSPKKKLICNGLEI